jgi:hypothetical protein
MDRVSKVSEASGALLDVNTDRADQSRPLSANGAVRFVVWTLFYLIPLSVALLPSVDEDIWWHLRSGQWMLEHRGLPTTDPFSRFGLDTGKPYIAYSWLFEVLAALLYRGFGLAGFALLRVVLMLAILTGLHRLIGRRQVSFASAAACSGLAAFALLPLITERPWLFTILFSIWTLTVIVDLRDGVASRFVWSLPLLYMIWANLHIQFVYGLFMLGLACAAPVIDRVLGREHDLSGAARAGSPTWWKLVFVTTACAAATLVNPFHVGLYRVIFEYAGQKANLVYVTEMHALEFRKLSDWCVLALAGFAVFSLGRRPHISAFEILLLAAAAWFAFRSRRDVWFIVAVAAAIVGPLPLPAGAWRRFLPTRMEAAAVVASVSLVLVALGRSRLSEASVQTALEAAYPVKAVEFIKRQGYCGPLYNSYNWGGYLMCELPDMPVAMDGRANFHGDARLERAMATRDGQATWQSDPDLATARLVILESETPLAALLRQDERFHLVDDGPVAVVFVARADGEYARK